MLFVGLGQLKQMLFIIVTVPYFFNTQYLWDVNHTIGTRQRGDWPMSGIQKRLLRQQAGWKKIWRMANGEWGVKIWSVFQGCFY
jgi:hypothetical protein